MQKMVLIVDDSRINRELLKRTLQSEYRILEAENGQEALDVMRLHHATLSAVLLDVVMPVMDGYETLEHIRDDALIAQIPVIIVTGSTDEQSRTKALNLGASDFLVKPFGPEIILHCIKNNIALRETASIVNTFQRDKLTGLYNRETFFEKAGELIAAHPEGYYVMACFDINSFKVINDQYGAEKGDQVLKHVAHNIRDCITPMGGICCRIAADNFAVLYPKEYMDSDTINRNHGAAMNPPCISRAISIRIGRYIVDDLTLLPSAMYDRATLAEDSIKGKYGQYIAYYNDSLRDRLLHEQEIVAGMTDALKNRQFEVWFQPQYNHSSGAMIGAEALVRWNYPKKGMIPPGSFIPIFEKNGFVYELDKYVWEETCRHLRRWIDDGRDPLPISVNISRFDLFCADFLQTLQRIVKKYNIPIQLLRLEVTESAFVDSTNHVIGIVGKLLDLGFTVEIDDFGSGYSSLNILKDIPAQILKLDMKFLESSGHSQRGGNILESIVSMAYWLNMSVIAEGVETKEYADYLRSIGCYYVQGYYYARPMPLADYEQLLFNCSKAPQMRGLETAVNLDNNAFWDPESMETLIFNSYVGGACIFEYYNGKSRLLRANERYAQELGAFIPKDAVISDKDLPNFLDEEGKRKLYGMIRECTAGSSEMTCELTLADPNGEMPDEYVRTTFRVIARAGERYLFYCVVQNMTEQKRAEQKEHNAEKISLEFSERLQAIMRSIDGGITAAVLHEDDSIELIFANDRYFELFGYTRELVEQESVDLMTLIHPEDYAATVAGVRKLLADRIPAVFEYRCIRRDGRIAFLRVNATVSRFVGVKDDVITSVTTDVTDEKELEKQFAFLNDTANEILAQPDAVKSIKNVLQKTLRYFAGTRVYIFEEDKENRTYSNTYEVCADGVIEEIDNLQKISLDSMAFWTNAFDTQRYIDIPNVEALPDNRGDKRLLLEQGIGALFAVPLMRDGVRIGFIGVDDPVLHKTDVSRLSAIGDYIAVMLTRRDLTARLREEADVLRKQGSQLKLLSDSIPGGMASFRYDAEGLHPLYFSDGFYNFSGYTHEEYSAVTKADQFALIHEEDRSKLHELLSAQARSCDENETFECDCRCRLKSGEYHWFTLKARVTDVKESGFVINLVLFDAQTTKELETQLESDRAKLQSILNAIPGGFAIFKIDENGATRIYISESASETIGYQSSDERITDMRDQGRVYAEDMPALHAAMKKTMAAKEPFNYDYRVLLPNGHTRWVNLTANPVETEEGLFYYGIYTDIEQRRAASEQLRMSREEYRLAVQLSGTLVSRYHVESSTLTVAHEIAAAHSVPERTDDVPYGQVRTGLIAPESEQDYIAFYESIRSGKKTGRAVFKKKLAIGWRWMEARFATIFDASGSPVHAIIAYTDVTDEREGRKAGEFERNALYYAVSDLYPTVLVSNLTENRYYVIDNKKFMNSAIPSSGVFDNLIANAVSTLPPDGADAFKTVFSRSSLLAARARGEKSVRLEHRQYDDAGVLHWMESIVFFAENPYDTDTLEICVIRNIDEQKENEEKLKAVLDLTSERLALRLHYGALINDIGTGFIIVRHINTGRADYYVGNLLKMFGYSDDEIAQGMTKGELADAIIHPDDAEMVREAFAKARELQIESFNCEFRVVKKDGSMAWVMACSTRFSDEKGVGYVSVYTDNTEQHELRERLRQSEEEHRLALLHSGSVVSRLYIRDRRMNLEPEIAAGLGVPEEALDMPYGPVRNGLVSPDTKTTFIDFYEGIFGGDANSKAVFQYKLADGWHWLEANSSVILSSEGKPASAVVSFIDITERLEKEKAYQLRMQALDDREPSSYIMYSVNVSREDSCFETVGGTMKHVDFDKMPDLMRERMEFYGQTYVYEEDRKQYMAHVNPDVLLADYHRGKHSDVLEYREILPNGNLRWLRLTIELVERPNSGDIEAILLHEDIDQMKKKELETLQRAETDPLTGLYNRKTFVEKFEKHITVHKDNALSALFIIDLDGFKQVNDSFGHIAGDETLIEIGQKLRDTFRKKDLICRLGGDEFMVCMCNVMQRSAIADRAANVCSMLQKSFSGEVRISASVGIAIWPDDGADFDSLYRKADCALYRVKETGKDGYALYSDSMRGAK